MYSKTTTIATMVAMVVVVSATIVLHLAAGAVVSSSASSSSVAVSGEPNGDRDDPRYWLKRKEWFYKRTRFSLTDDNLKLLGLKGRTETENRSAQPVGHLPFWFDYELYKKVFNKTHGAEGEQEELERHQVYISTCVRVLKARVLFRMLAGTSDTLITDDADKFYWEKFGPMGQAGAGTGSKADDESSPEIALLARFKVEPQLRNESPLDRAIRLVHEEMKIVESKNQVETNIRSFNEVDGSALAGKLPY